MAVARRGAVGQQRWAEPSDFPRAIKGSRAVVAVIKHMRRSPLFTEPVADIGSYIQRAVELGARTSGDAHNFIFEELRSLLGQAALDKLAKQWSGDLLDGLSLSPGLRAVFSEAVEIRASTGGKDQYIGARHVIAAILTSRQEAVTIERQQLWEVLGGTPTAIVQSLADMLRTALEENESAKVWSDILRDRGFEDEAAAFVRETADPTPTPGSDPDSEIDPMKSAYQRRAIAGYLNDNPWSMPDGQLKGVDNIADALARLVAAVSFEPPLAIGVFGKWGSGKSLLMRRMYDRIKELQEEGDNFHHDIVQINFNAWHYLDTDLWASLAGSIFEELEAFAKKRNSAAKTDNKGPPYQPDVLNQLTTARKLTLESARELAASRQATRLAEKAVQDAEAALAYRHEVFADVLRQVVAVKHAVNAAAKTWLAGDKPAREAIQATYGRELEEMASLWTSPQEAVESLRQDRIVWMETVRQIGRWRTVLAVLIFAGGCMLISYAEPVLQGEPKFVANILSKLTPIAAGASGFVTAAAIAITAFTRRAIKARDAVVAAMVVYQSATKKTATGNVEDIDKGRENIRTARSNLERARSSLHQALTQQATADVAFAGDTPAGRLRGFVAARAALDGPYRTKQGLIGTIRRDFSDLAALMNPKPNDVETQKRKMANEAWIAEVTALKASAKNDLSPDELKALDQAAHQLPVHPFRRIMLYIDDLDRCQPEKVVEVLQAVHLLLAHSLFVVVVAVDIRWLIGSLQKVHPEQLHDLLANGRVKGHGKGKPAVLDYLEKIFQLPVWTEMMPAERASALVRACLEERSADRKEEQTGEKGGGLLAAGGLNQRLETQLPIQGFEDMTDKRVTGVAISGRRTDKEKLLTSQPLRLEIVEIEYLSALAERLGCSPRRLLRMVNTYRVARAGVVDEMFQPLLAGGYRGLGLLLALAAAYPNQFPRITATLVMNGQWDSIEDGWGADWDDDKPSTEQHEDLMRFLTDENVQIELEVLPYVELARRFSFTG